MRISYSLRALISAMLVLLCIGKSTSALACPALDSYYPADSSQWPEIRQNLQILLPECLLSAEYFALLGASQLNTGALTSALESLERALLIDPAYAAAQVDYAQALYQAGQLFPALELNKALLVRTDVPEPLQAVLLQRERSWRSETLKKGARVEIATGYDNNLNGGPSSSDLTLTLSGEQLNLVIDEAFQPVSGPYLNLRVAGFLQKQSAEYTQDVLVSARSRVSEHSQSDLIQLDWRYSLGSLWREHLWNVTAGTSHLLYGGSPLYSVTEARFYMRHDGPSACQPQYELATQYQHFHGQSTFSGLETSVSTGFECQMQESMVFGVEAGALYNHAIEEARPGSSRDGWKLRLYWQQALGKGHVSAQASLSSLQDSSGYNEILANAAVRSITNRLFLVQYGQVLREKIDFVANVSHQEQGSNLTPFQSKSTRFELGINLNF